MMPAASRASTFSGLLVIKPDRADAELLQDRGRQFELPAVRPITQLYIGLNRVEAPVLELVSSQFRHQANPAPLLLFIEQDARSRIGNPGQGQLKLLPAVAAQRVEDVARQALRVNPHDRRPGVDVAHDQGNRPFRAHRRSRPARLAGLRRNHSPLKAENTKVPPAGREVRIGNFPNTFQWHGNIIDALTPASIPAAACIPPGVK